MGTVRSNKKGFSQDSPTDADVQKGTAVFTEHNDIVLMMYRAAKDILEQDKNCRLVDFLKNRTNYLIVDKLLPVSNMVSSRSEENINLRHFQHMMVSQCW